MKNRSDLVTRALRNLGVLPQGHTANVEEAQSMDALIDGMLDELSSRGIVYVGDPDNIDEDVFQPLGAILADRAKAEFGVAGDQTIALMAEKAERDLITIGAGKPTGETLVTDYF